MTSSPLKKGISPAQATKWSRVQVTFKIIKTQVEPTTPVRSYQSSVLTVRPFFLPHTQLQQEAKKKGFPELLCPLAACSAGQEAPLLFWAVQSPCTHHRSENTASVSSHGQGHRWWRCHIERGVQDVCDHHDWGFSAPGPFPTQSSTVFSHPDQILPPFLAARCSVAESGNILASVGKNRDMEMSFAAHHHMNGNTLRPFPPSSIDLNNINPIATKKVLPQTWE